MPECNWFFKKLNFYSLQKAVSHANVKIRYFCGHLKIKSSKFPWEGNLERL